MERSRRSKRLSPNRFLPKPIWRTLSYTTTRLTWCWSTSLATLKSKCSTTRRVGNQWEYPSWPLGVETRAWCATTLSDSSCVWYGIYWLLKVFMFCHGWFCAAQVTDYLRNLQSADSSMVYFTTLPVPDKGAKLTALHLGQLGVDLSSVTPKGVFAMPGSKDVAIINLKVCNCFWS